MASAPSPRASSIASSPMSSRTASPAPHPSRARANRAALRDYYGLKAAAPADATAPDSPIWRDDADSVQRSELDADGFDADAYVQQVLEKESLQGLLKTEAGLISDIRSLDGEKKALVYDNYSKLIAATDTIRTLRSNMSPLKPTTASLNPAMAHIVDMTVDLTASLKNKASTQPIGDQPEDSSALELKKRQQETVRWVLGTPTRLRKILQEERITDAAADWNEIRGLLDGWGDVDGSAELRQECETIMGEKRL